MKIEERIRREKRAQQLAQIRKPLLSTPGTPGTKRSRNAPEIWDGTRDLATTASGQNSSSTSRKRTQRCLETDQTPAKIMMQPKTKMTEEECKTQAVCNARAQPYQPEQTPTEMVSQPKARMRSRQTPLTSFTIKQSLEERRTTINFHDAQVQKMRETVPAQQNKDMSSSSPTPSIKRRTRRTQEKPC